MPRDAWPRYSISWRQWRIIDWIYLKGGVAESSMIVRECSGGDAGGDGMGTIERTTVYRNLDQLEEAKILILEIMKTIGGRVFRYYRINWESSGLSPPPRYPGQPSGPTPQKELKKSGYRDFYAGDSSSPTDPV